jgi:TRAP-type C4-dicarboxylate transport system permease small subunit
MKTSLSTFTKKSRNGFSTLVAGSAHLGAIVLGIMTLLIFVDVTLRRFFNRPLAYSFELIELMLAVVFFVAVIYTSNEDRHVSIDLLTSRLSSGAQKTIDMVMDFISAALFLLIGWVGFNDGIQSREINEMTGILRIHHYPFYFFMALCFAIAGVAILIKVFRKTSSGKL